MEENGVEWMTKAEAVAWSGVSLRTIEREISLQKIRTKQRRQIGRRSVTVLHPDDVQRLRSDFTPVAVEGASLPVSNGETHLPSVHSQSDVVTSFLQYIRPIVEGTPAFLPIKEAAEYIGLPEGYLRRLVKEGKLTPIIHGGYFIRLSDLHRL